MRLTLLPPGRLNSRIFQYLSYILEHSVNESNGFFIVVRHIVLTFGTRMECLFSCLVIEEPRKERQIVPVTLTAVLRKMTIDPNRTKSEIEFLE